MAQKRGQVQTRGFSTSRWPKNGVKFNFPWTLPFNCGDSRGWVSISDPVLVEKLISLLSPREATIVRMRYGLSDHHVHTVAEISESIGLSKGRIYQIEGKAFRRMMWVCRNVDIHDPEALDAEFERRQAKAAKHAEHDAEHETQVQNAKEHARRRRLELEQERAARQRAESAKNARRRKLHLAEADLLNLRSLAADLNIRIARMEQHGWFTKKLRGRRLLYQLSTLREQRMSLSRAIKHAEERVSGIYADPPAAKQTP
ncbi:sigma factor-like helix-turn-helix DNA-binding protein (plasmid) [Glycocaulis abyssi]|uniref:Sigma factor-like helix-turn-helix DNA-binding protein n=1 Tax=Glycocaulis abyssi TaxID=1433403 RepID=A0ABV9NEC4_9PROT